MKDVGCKCLCRSVPKLGQKFEYDFSFSFIPINKLVPESSHLLGWDIWTDGTNIYFSYGSDQYILNGDTWEIKTWNGKTVKGSYIWTDGTNIYYSSYTNGVSAQYVLNGDTWEEKTWNIANFNAGDIWTDGVDIYYTSASVTYVLNGDTWERKTWNGNIPSDGANIWTDGTNIYYSSYSINGTGGEVVPEHYVLNGDTWEEKVWNINTFYGGTIWTDGTNIYHSSANTNIPYLVLKGGSWEEVDNNRYTPFIQDIWTDGINIYSMDGRNYMLLPTTAKLYSKFGFAWKEVSSIQTGGGGESGSISDLDALIEGTLTEVTSNATKVKNYVFYHHDSLKAADFPLATSIGASAFIFCSQLTSVNLPNATSIGNQAFQGTKLISVDLPSATSIGDSAFLSLNTLTSVNLPSVTSISANAFGFCKQLTKVDLPNVTSIGGEAFYMCSALHTVIMRSSTVCTIRHTNVIGNTPIASGTGYIYVPRDLVDSYKSATNWSTYASQFRALEDYTVDGTTTGELDMTKI